MDSRHQQQAEESSNVSEIIFAGKQGEIVWNRIKDHLGLLEGVSAIGPGAARELELRAHTFVCIANAGEGPRTKKMYGNWLRRHMVLDSINSNVLRIVYQVQPQPPITIIHRGGKCTLSLGRVAGVTQVFPITAGAYDEYVKSEMSGVDFDEKRVVARDEGTSSFYIGGVHDVRTLFNRRSIGLSNRVVLGAFAHAASSMPRLSWRDDRLYCHDGEPDLPRVALAARNIVARTLVKHAGFVAAHGSNRDKFVLDFRAINDGRTAKKHQKLIRRTVFFLQYSMVKSLSDLPDKDGRDRAEWWLDGSDFGGTTDERSQRLGALVRQRMQRDSRKSGETHCDLDAATIGTRQVLTPEQFFERETQFFRLLLDQRPVLTGEQFRSELERHLQDESVANKTYGEQVNYKWVQLLSLFLEATGLRVVCLGGECDAPSIPRYLPAGGKDRNSFRTEHYDSTGTQKRHGGPVTIPSFSVVFATPRSIKPKPKRKQPRRKKIT